MIASAEKTCNICGGKYPIESYRFRNRKLGLRHGQCRKCRNEWGKLYRLRHRAEDAKKYLLRVRACRGDVSRIEAVFI